MRHAVETGCRWVDLNFLKTSDGVIVCTHWRRILAHGFEDPTGRYGPSIEVGDIPWHDLRLFRSTRGDPEYRVRRAEDIIPYALGHGIGVEFEAKTSRFTVEDYRHIRSLDTTRTDRLDDPGRIQVKTMGTLPPRPWVRLERAHDAGLTTILLCHRKGIRVPHSARPSIDFYRGYRPVWV